MKLLIEAKYIPDGTVVTKKTGSQQFTIRDSIKIYTYDTKGSNALKEILNADGVKYMVNNRGDINMVSADTVLCVDLNVSEEESDDISIDAFQDVIYKMLSVRYPDHAVEVYINVELPQ